MVSQTLLQREEETWWSEKGGQEKLKNRRKRVSSASSSSLELPTPCNPKKKKKKSRDEWSERWSIQGWRGKGGCGWMGEDERGLFSHLPGRLWIDQHLREGEREGGRESEKKGERQSREMKDDDEKRASGKSWVLELSYKTRRGENRVIGREEWGKAAEEVWRLIFFWMGVSLGRSRERPGSTA